MATSNKKEVVKEEEGEMLPWPSENPNSMRLEPTPAMHKSIYALYFDGQLVGTAVAIHPSILITAGHHYLTTKDDVGSMTVKNHFYSLHPEGKKEINAERVRRQQLGLPLGRRSRSRGENVALEGNDDVSPATKKARVEPPKTRKGRESTSSVQGGATDDIQDATALEPLTVKTGQWQAAWAQKDQHRDLLVLWINGTVPAWTEVRAVQPPVGSRIVTCWIQLSHPFELVRSPGEISISDKKICQSKGTITIKGASGGAVLDHNGETLIGIHIATNDNQGHGRLAEFLCAREIIQVLQRMEVDPHKPWHASDEMLEEEAPAVSGQREKIAPTSTGDDGSAKAQRSTSSAKNSKKLPDKPTSSVKPKDSKLPAVGTISGRKPPLFDPRSGVKSTGGKQTEAEKLANSAAKLFGEPRVTNDSKSTKN